MNVLKKVLDRVIAACIMAGIYIVAWNVILIVFNPQPATWCLLKWILATFGVVGGTALYVRGCYTIGELVSRYVKVEKISDI